MALSVFPDESKRPDERALRSALGASSTLWEDLISFAASRWAPLEEEWAFSSKQAGWSVRLKHKKKILLYLIPQQGWFLVGVVLGDRAVETARRAALPAAVLEQINGARKYAEGTGFRFAVKTREDLEAAQRLALIKMGAGTE
jgi:hypothetical protein